MKSLTLVLPLVAMSVLLSSCDNGGESTGGEPKTEPVKGAQSVSEAIFGQMPDGADAKIFTLANANGMEAKITEYGAILVSLTTPDKNGTLADVTHGYDTLEGWLTNTSYFGATVGRFGNRIADGKFTLDGKEYTLATNNDPGGIPCHLHGGIKGFDKVLWKGESFEGEGARGVNLTYVSPDGEEGYPGTLTTVVTYTLTDKNELIWEARATSDAPTVLNVVHHSYWNLSGDATTSINDHELTLYAEHYLPTDAGLIPTGQVASVAETPMDFRSAHVIGERVEAAFEALKLGAGYDHAWVLSGEKDGELNKAARLKDPETGRVMTISTNQPAIQFYGGNFLDGTVTGKGGVVYEHRTALCLETENYPDAPNNPEAPSAVLRAGETYYHKMVHAFSAE
ncbi:MAG: galactose-1-epimerase [Verrucomicrobiales bacterium]|mgnify:FL=1|nr:galactose-1-epimerase [Verrucomicrobiales bacterium]|tara:strand:+ start:1392 stop:2582 length:1191 start_codon:yes stop_codon:yes gene_type:complete